jgi:hypothetical protein
VEVDLSMSVLADMSGPAHDMRLAMQTAHSAMLERPLPGDALGVTVFAGNARSWVPLGPLDRPGLEGWLSSLGPAEHAPLSFATASPLRPDEWSPAPLLPTELGLEAFATDPWEGLHNALVELRRTGNGSLKAIVLLWDGEQTSESTVRGLLNRLWNREIHVFTVAVGTVHPEGLDARGGGDVYLAQGRADLAMRRIIGQLRMPGP